MTFFTQLGERFRAAAGVGSRFLSNAAGVGQRFVSTSRSVLKGLEATPVLGEALKAAPGYNTVQSGLNFLDKAAGAAKFGADVLAGKFGGLDPRMVSAAQKIKSDFEAK